MGIRSQWASFAGSATSQILRSVLHRSASQLPGRVGLAIDPQLIEHLRGKLRCGSIVVCGTNGKTTTTNIIAEAIEASGASVLCNHAGANMASGVATALLPGRAADWAVIEADELSTVHIVPALRPRLLVLLNLYRDQLDRAGEIDHVQDVIVQALAASPETELLACGDDPLSVGVALRAEQAGVRVRYFGIGEDLKLPPDRVPEAAFCQRCGALLAYRYRAFAQLGDFYCPSCDFGRPALAASATQVSATRDGVAFSAQLCGEQLVRARIRAAFGGTYTVYNLLAALAASAYAGVTPELFQNVLSGYRPSNGRYQRFEVAGREVVLNLAKNPAGFNQNISLMQSDERDKAVYVVINDHDNDGKDVSWLWDVDFERLSTEGERAPLRMLAGGHRANDMQLRLKYAGISAKIAGTVAEALGQIGDVPLEAPLYVLTNYSALWPAKAELERLSGGEDRA